MINKNSNDFFDLNISSRSSILPHISNDFGIKNEIQEFLFLKRPVIPAQAGIHF